MLEEFRTASGLLQVALERYINASFALRDGYSYRNTINSAEEIRDFVANEMGLITSYKSGLTQAQVAINQARNSLANVPINALPAEVLTYIFHLVSAEQPCTFQTPHYWDDDAPVDFPKYPDMLAHVCSQWRQVALASHALWSHIDIALSCPLTFGLYERAKTYATRARQIPMDIHIVDPGHFREAEKPDNSGSSEFDFTDNRPPNEYEMWEELMYEINPDDFDFLSLNVASRIRTLGLLVHHQYHPIHSRALEHCLANCLPGDLSELNVCVPGGSYSFPMFIKPGSLSRYSTDVALSEQQLERAWESVTTLRLKGRYPIWTSTAYHGLTHLQLEGSCRISGSELISFLKSNPQLRVIRCDLRIKETPPSGANLSPVILNELEIIDLVNAKEEDAKNFLQWVTTGSNPLQLSLCCNPTSTVLKDFLARSNVRELRVRSKSRWSYDNLPLAKFYLPLRLRVLAVDEWENNSPSQHNPIRHFHSSRTEAQFPLDLDALYMLSCCYEDFEHFRDFVGKCSPQRLILGNCTVARMDSRIPVDLTLLESETGGDLSQLSPSVEVLTASDPSPFPDWNRSY
ncbi:hypothetical protein RSOLAG1IB_05156 [Rhizoctonia solani AG-1 IB]|uniref:Uncharacterized protein n=1 Tax=Thanatephorus cucumeris (strain AG1-IB / isolate 7/3/14) TaxID=1108050 RepID=A0A0B7FYX4_THACB|nr:hypothetical protein RSOLAG1IB_05156 [Rhizoctonia solani AG-1 IB]